MAAQLRIGIDARAAAEEPAGRGRYVRELLRALDALGTQHEFTLLARQRWEEPLGARMTWRLLGSDDPLWNLGAARAASSGCDVFLSTNSYLTGWFTRVPTALVVYDMIAWFPAMQPQRRAARIEKATIGRALRRAAATMCISQSTERDLLERFSAARGKTQVITPGVAGLRPPDDLDGVRRRLGLPDRFVLATGTLEPRKNLPRLIEAHARLTDAPPLLVAGPEGWELERATAGAAGREGVRLLGFVSDADLAALYRLCTVFAYPSLYEGFGFPLAEAMSCGAACVTSNVSSLPEVGGDAVVYCDPVDTGSIAAGLHELLRYEERRRELGELARRQAASFTWERTARQTLAVLERIAR